MARLRQFRREEVLESAMQLFWSKGYRATSVRDLTNAMGLSKSSLYDCFGSKHQLFLEAIDFYRENVTSRMRSVLELKMPARQVIVAVLNRAIDRILEPGGRRGCFLNNCAVEVCSNDREAALRCRTGMKVMEETFLRLVCRAQDENTIAIDKDPEALAHYLNCTVNGIMVMGKTNPDRTLLEGIAGITMSNL